MSIQMLTRCQVDVDVNQKLLRETLKAVPDRTPTMSTLRYVVLGPSSS